MSGRSKRLGAGGRFAGSGNPRGAIRRRSARRTVRGARTPIQVAVRDLAGTERRGAGQRADGGGILERRAYGTADRAQDGDLVTAPLSIALRDPEHEGVR